MHAGKGWGYIDLPRIGEEVIVDFLEGDPINPSSLAESIQRREQTSL